MNYLAHIFLSGDNRSLQIGNFIGDFVKGNQYENYPPAIREGIILHREIDYFTDTHPAFIEVVHMLRPTFKRYSGIIADMYFDYLLASDFEAFHPKKSLKRFSYEFNLTALWYYRQLPERVKGFIFHFIMHNRLYQYASYEGLYNSLTIMSKYKTNAIKPTLSIDFLKENEGFLRAKFMEFMPDIINFVEQKKK